MNFLGAVLLMLSSIFSGFYAGRLLKKRCDIMQECISLMQWFSSSISYADEPLNMIIEKAVSSNEFKELAFLKKISESDLSEGFSCAWNNSIDEDKALDKRIASLLKSFGIKIGKTDVNDQIELCAYYKREFERLFQSAAQKHTEQIKLYRIAGYAVGALLFVIFV